jgi:hypothetical protein
VFALPGTRDSSGETPSRVTRETKGEQNEQEAAGPLTGQSFKGAILVDPLPVTEGEAEAQAGAYEIDETS